MLVNRGGCPFAHKIRAATKIGASVLLVADYSDPQGGDSSFIKAETWDKDGILEFHIPLFEISFHDA